MSGSSNLRQRDLPNPEGWITFAQARGWTTEPLGLIGRGCSPDQFIFVQLKDTLQAIRPCRESQTGWTPEAEMFPGNHSSWALNERGPALKVFWSRRGRDGRRVGERALAKASPRGKRTVDQKTEPEGAGQETSGPLLSVRKLVQPRHQPRTRQIQMAD
jgi:hypothetical protein